MLTELRIENFAIIDRLELRPEPGLVILTGETGAGKSIILDAVEMLLGGRADNTLIRSEADRAYVEGVFRLDGFARQAVHRILEREDLLDDPDYLTLAREVRREGRNVARVNGRTVSVSLLKELGTFLVDIHGQSEHLSLLNVRNHLSLLDRYANLGEALATYRQTYTELQNIRRELDELRRAQADAERRTELLTYQVEEIEAARLRPGEEEEARQERDRLANAEALANLAQEALTALDEGTPEAPAATDLVGQASRALAKLAQIDSAHAALAEQAIGIEETLSDLSRALRTYLEEIEFNPRRLEQLEERLDLIHRLKRKYGESIPEILAFAENARRELETITHATERITELEEQEQRILAQLAKQAQALSQQRKTAAEALSRQIEAELNDLRMSHARFSVDFRIKPDENGLPMPDGSRLAFDATGFDRVEFLIAPNPGEGFKPLAKIASGGETSRLMLALKNVLARADQVPTLIFDEIDQGIGGRVGLVVGQKLWNLARRHQVFCVTHLPQLAAFGDQHLQVQKVIQQKRTITRVEHLEGEARLLELAQMLGEVGEGTLRSAHEILQTARSLTHPAGNAG
ncbi:MAG: DNA repair protein RecN [Anaerolineae bacterium]|nr:MAG: DNA repair protein RecN [Anaerolineae bacterium]